MHGFVSIAMAKVYLQIHTALNIECIKMIFDSYHFT